MNLQINYLFICRLAINRPISTKHYFYNNLTGLYCQNKIREDIYNRQIADILNEKTRITETIEKYKDIKKRLKKTLIKFLMLLEDLSYYENTVQRTKDKMLKRLIFDCKLSRNNDK